MHGRRRSRPGDLHWSSRKEETAAGSVDDEVHIPLEDGRRQSPRLRASLLLWVEFVGWFGVEFPQLSSYWMGKDLDADREDGLSQNTMPVPTLNDDMPMLEKHRQHSKFEPIAMVMLNPSQPHACPPTLSPTPPAVCKDGTASVELHRSRSREVSTAADCVTAR